MSDITDKPTKNFEEQFPSLKGQESRDPVWGYTEETIQKHLLDKQRVRDIINNLKMSDGRNWNQAWKNQLREELDL